MQRVHTPYVRKPDANCLPRPSYYEDAMKTIMQHRPFTPPFQGLDATSRIDWVNSSKAMGKMFVMNGLR